MQLKVSSLCKPKILLLCGARISIAIAIAVVVSLSPLLTELLLGQYSNIIMPQFEIFTYENINNS